MLCQLPAARLSQTRGNRLMTQPRAGEGGEGREGACIGMRKQRRPRLWQRSGWRSTTGTTERGPSRLPFFWPSALSFPFLFVCFRRRCHLRLTAPLPLKQRYFISSVRIKSEYIFSTRQRIEPLPRERNLTALHATINQTTSPSVTSGYR